MMGRNAMLALAAHALCCAAHAAGPVVAVERISVADDGSESMADSFSSAISADGRYVAFDSADANIAKTLTAAADNAYYVYVRDRVLQHTERVAIGVDGKPANALSYGPAISADGRYVAFTSAATNLTNDDTNGVTDVFVRDRLLRTTVRASVAGDGPDTGGGGYAEAGYSMPNWFSANGRFVIFASYAKLTSNDTNGLLHLYRRDLVAGITELVSVNPSGAGVNNVNAGGAISADGRFVMFQSAATDIVTGNPGFAIMNLFVRDMALGVTTSLTPNVSTTDLCWFGSGDNASYNLSPNGRFAIFNSNCHDLAPGQDVHDTLFVRDLTLATTAVLRLTDNGMPDLHGGAFLNISNSGRDAVAWSDSTAIGAGDADTFADVFLRDRTGARTLRISTSIAGTPPDASSFAPSSNNAGHIVFASDATNLVANDGNGHRDIFVATLDGLFAAGFE